MPVAKLRNLSKGLRKALKPAARPTAPQLRWLRRGLDQAGGKLPLFDEEGQRVSERTVRSCIDRAGPRPGLPIPSSPIGKSAS